MGSGRVQANRLRFCIRIYHGNRSPNQSFQPRSCPTTSGSIFLPRHFGRQMMAVEQHLYARLSELSPD